MSKKRLPAFIRFWDKVEKTDSCWIWKAGMQSEGYGQFRLDDKMLLAHRVSFWLIKGYWPKQANHKCNVRACVRPDESHVIDGNNSSNQIDSVINGTHHFVKLKTEQVKEIKNCPNIRGSQREFAKKYGISEAQVSFIKNGKEWGWL